MVSNKKEILSNHDINNEKYGKFESTNIIKSQIFEDQEQENEIKEK